MKTNLKNLLTLLLLVSAASSASLATPTTTAQKQNQQQSQTLKTPQGPALQLEVSYYDGDPLNGGKLLKTETVQPQRGTAPFQNAPEGAKFASVKTNRGTNVIDLSQQPDPADPAMAPQGQMRDGRGGPQGQQQGPRDMKGPQGGKGDFKGPQGGKGGMKGPQGGKGDFKGPQGGPRGLQNADSVTFYDGDPLNGGKVTLSFDQKGLQDQTKVDAAAKTAKFAVVDHGGHRDIVDLSQVPQMPTPQGR